MTSVKEVTTFNHVHLEEKYRTVQSNYSDQLVIRLPLVTNSHTHTCFSYTIC